MAISSSHLMLETMSENHQAIIGATPSARFPVAFDSMAGIDLPRAPWVPLIELQAGRAPRRGQSRRESGACRNPPSGTTSPSRLRTPPPFRRIAEM